MWETLYIGLNRKQKASEARLSPKRFSLLLETQHPTNLKNREDKQSQIKIKTLKDVKQLSIIIK